MNKLYKKVGRKYEPVGVEFTGWPHAGYWVVLDGRYSLLAPIEHPRPLELCRIMQYRESIVSNFDWNKPRSHFELVTDLLTTLEELIDKDNGNEH